MEPVIEVFRTATGWVADFKDDKDMLELFNTTVIPTCFTARAEEYVVLAEIERLNPHCNVVLNRSRYE